MTEPRKTRATWKLVISLNKTTTVEGALVDDVRAAVTIDTTEGYGLDDLQTALGAVREARAKRGK